MINPTVNSKNLRNYNIALKTQEVINRCGFNSSGEKKDLKLICLAIILVIQLKYVRVTFTMSV